jgi:HK97 gp10 family phage protein
MIECKVTGLKELQDELLTLSPKIANQALQGALVAASYPIVKEAQKNIIRAIAPYRLYTMAKDRLMARAMGLTSVAQVVEPGWLEKNLVRKRVKQDQHSAQTIIAFKNQRQAFFWKFIEFGTSKMKATPFLRPAFESQQQVAVDRFKESLTEKLKDLTSLKVGK